MALRRSLSALSRLVPAACSEGAPLAQSSSQQPLSLWRCLPCQGFAASAAALQSAPAPASAPTSTSATAGAAAAALRLGGEGPAAAALPEVYARLEEGVAQLYSVQPKRVFAVVEVGGTQYKVTPNDVIVVEKLAGVDVNDKLQLQRVLLLGSQAETIIGRPYVPDATVTAAVEEQFLDGKVLIFHKRRRKNSRRLKGHRQPLTTLRVLDVSGIAEATPARDTA